MKYSLRPFLRGRDETWMDYYSRGRYNLLRRILFKYREQHRLESLVGPKNCWQQLQQYQFNILTSLGLRPHHSLLDIGCGPLTAGLKLIPYLGRGNYVGLDISTRPLIEAYRLIAKNLLVERNPRIIHSTTSLKNELKGHQFDYIWMSQLSYHLDNLQMKGLFEATRSMMGPNSVFVFDILAPETILPPDAEWSGFSFHVRPFSFYEEISKEFALFMTKAGTIGDYGYPKRIDLKSNQILKFQTSKN